jgi:CDP-diacylglycerol---glycerol-3-phosphate 3-phosphatidyltransferase
MGTGYLNLQKEFLDAMGQRKDKVSVLTSSPRANGFYKAGRVKKYIPGIYRVNETKMLKKFPQISIHEWESGDWTFHGKGAWLYNQEGTVDMSVVGSSNFSHRSNRKDTEAQLYILASDCKDLQSRLADEADNLYANSN